MKHKLLFAAAATALLAPSMAAAQDSGVYLRGQLGYGIFDDIDLENRDDDVVTSGLAGETGSSGELAASLGLGYDFGNNWRVELDGTSLYNDLGSIDGNPSSKASIRSTALMLNAIYDFSDFGRWEPYVGAGVGIARPELSASAHDLLNPNFDTDTDLDGDGIDGIGTEAFVRHPNCITGPFAANQARTCDINTNDKTFAWNLMAGLGYNITDNLTWDTTYRYLDLGSPEFDGVAQGVGFAGNGASEPITTSVDDLNAHLLMTGFRYRFGASTPEPVVVVPVAPPPPVTFTCFDGSVVTDRALCPPPPPPPPTTFTCEGSGQVVTDLALCPPRTECPDGSIVYGPAEFCPTRSGETIQALCAEQFRQEIIYYEFDRGQSAETRNTINRILDIGQFCQVDNIRVVGHTDTSGAASYNLNLSKRRASDAREELVRQGVNPAIITSEGKGETEPFVQTGDGVKEQLNRRTEVLIQLSEVGMRDMTN